MNFDSEFNYPPITFSLMKYSQGPADDSKLYLHEEEICVFTAKYILPNATSARLRLRSLGWLIFREVELKQVSA